MSKMIGLFYPAETRAASSVGGVTTFRELSGSAQRREIVVATDKIVMLRPCVILPMLGPQLSGVILDCVQGSMIVFGTVAGLAQLCGVEYVPSEPPLVSLKEVN